MCFRLGILASQIKSDRQAVAAEKRIGMFRSQYLFFPLDELPKIRFRLGILASLPEGMGAAITTPELPCLIEFQIGNQVLHFGPLRRRAGPIGQLLRFAEMFHRAGILNVLLCC